LFETALADGMQVFPTEVILLKKLGGNEVLDTAFLVVLALNSLHIR